MSSGETAAEKLEGAIAHRDAIIGERESAIAALEARLHNTSGLQHTLDDLKTELQEKIARIAQLQVGPAVQKWRAGY